MHPPTQTHTKQTPTHMQTSIQGNIDSRVFTSCITFLRQSRLAITDLQWPECRSCYRIRELRNPIPHFAAKSYMLKFPSRSMAGAPLLACFLRGKMYFMNKMPYHNSHKVKDDTYAILFIMSLCIYTHCGLVDIQNKPWFYRKRYLGPLIWPFAQRNQLEQLWNLCESNPKTWYMCTVNHRLYSWRS